MSIISYRIKEALEANNMKQSELVKITGINKSALSSYLSGKYEPKQTNIYLMAKALNVNEAWLMGLDVPMERNKPSILVNDLSADEKQHIDKYRKLDTFDKIKTDAYMDGLLDSDKYK